MIDLNFDGKPHFLEEFLEDAHILTAIEKDNGRHIRELRMSLEPDINRVAGGDWAFMLDKIFNYQHKKINAVKNQQEYNDLYKELYDAGCLAIVISGNLRLRCEIIRHRIEQITYDTQFSVCPCCGKEIDEDFINGLREDANNSQQLIFFYEGLYKGCMDAREKMKQLATKMGFNLYTWQKEFCKVIGALARVETIEGKPSEVQQVKKQQAKLAESYKGCSMESVAREWLARKRAVLDEGA